jgi:hypothetical protein
MYTLERKVRKNPTPHKQRDINPISNDGALTGLVHFARLDEL